MYYLLLGRKTFWNKLLSKTMTFYKNREFKHDVYSRRQTAKITSEFVCFSSNPQLYKLRKNRKMSPTIHRNYKYSYSTQKTSENRQQKFHVLLNHSNHILLPKFYTNAKWPVIGASYIHTSLLFIPSDFQSSLCS